VVLLILPISVANAVSISGIVLYGADDFGTPNGDGTYEGEISAQLWRTLYVPGTLWHALAVWEGLPPDAFRNGPLSAPNFMIEIPLVQGENVFTIAGEEGALTRPEPYLRYTLNLYFDGNIDGPPGISVIFRRWADPNGDRVDSNRSSYIYNLALQPVEATPGTYYDDGYDRVTVSGASFMEPEKFNPDFDFDFLEPQRFGKSGKKDFLGVLRIMVEPSQGEVDAGAAPRAIVPAFGGGTGSVGGQGYGGNPGYVPNPGYGGLPEGGANPYRQAVAPPTAQRAAQQQARQQEEAEPTAEGTPADETPQPTTAAPQGTPTPAKTTTKTTSTPGAKGTPSLKPTDAPVGTPTAPAATPAATKRSGTPATPSAARTRTP
jgi:hypothetical protein